MTNSTSHIAFEKKVIASMIRIYCDHKHCQNNELCEDCHKIYHYCTKRLDKCPFGENKPACQNCQVHCYEKVMRQRVRKIMSYAGPRMLYRHPFMSLKHLYQSKIIKALSLKEYKQIS
ncbi:nitrous oxide-stimulated promoter family protein [Lentisphaera profundi]|uniref:Nitrous oxide-stimulated promoter family protein n=1 Tax=Lentisphaera profundi TaxID=1658616 RepID=A0ABY7VPZ3_9BACT|nr:nitrous oxide-stimulated promoter family protein [Lentisphaera profundi]WDE96246.1 nitrous oxide-stimulated promoter family protein [Lentisphaera profundi]